MSNFIKPTMKGGFEYTAGIYICGVKTVKGKQTKISSTQCIKDFTTLNNLTVVETADDGNCFYDTLSKYGQRTGNPTLNKPNIELRREIIGSMLKPERLNELLPFFVENANIAPGSEIINVDPIAELEKFLEPYQWAGWMGDIVPQIAADILNINIHIYDVRVIDPSNVIDRLIFSGRVPDATTVIMLRTNGSHFRLLWPKDMPILPRGKKTITAKKINRNKKTLNKKPVNKKPVNKKPVNIINNTINKIAKMELVNKKLNNSKRPTTRSKSKQANKSRSPSPYKENKSTKKRITRKRTTSLENNLMKIALQESKENSNIRNKSKKINNNFFNALDEANFNNI
jgi:hypothetical protein